MTTRALRVAPPGERISGGGARFFPDEADRSSALPPADVAALRDGPSAAYAALVEAVAAAAAGRAGLPLSAARAVARDPVVLLTHVFLDRALRLKRLVDAGGRGAWSAPGGALEAPVLWTSLVGDATTSRAFNEAVLGRVARVWSLPGAPAAQDAGAAPRGAANLNFAAPGLARRALWKARRVSSRAFGRVPTLGRAYADSCFLDAGLVGPGAMADLDGPQDPAAPPADPGLRAAVRDGAAKASGPVEALLASWGFDAAERAAAAGELGALLADLYPRARLEDLPRRLAASRAALSRWAKTPLLLSEIGDDRTACMIAAARGLGMPVVGIQHGAHYGFVDAPCHIEFEYAQLDRFVTWGWTKTPDHPLSRGVETIPLPSPWLSERARRWRRELGAPAAGRRRDVLLMTERVSRYPATLTTVRLNRLDELDALDAELEGLVGALAGRGLSVLHKPFNAASAEAQALASERLLARHPGLYETHGRLDKGLTAELLSSCGVVVWDEPGGGIFECLVSGIPSLLLWTPARYPMSPRAERPFRLLEEAGVMHRGVETLAAAAEKAAADPAGWLADPSRRDRVAEACRELAWADDDWARPWRAFVRSL